MANRYLLENGTDAYLLEDGSGNYVLEGVTGDLAVSPAMSGSGHMEYSGSGTLAVAPTMAGVGQQTQSGSGSLAVAPVLSGGAPTFAEIRQQIIDGLVSAQGEATGWNAERVNIPATAVARTSDTVVTITLPALADYNIEVQETVTVTVPNIALAGQGDLVGSPVFTIDPALTLASGSLVVAPSLSGTGQQTQSGSGDLTVTLVQEGAGESLSLSVEGTGSLAVTLSQEGSGYQTHVGSGDLAVTFGLSGTGTSASPFDGQRQSILNGLVSDKNELWGWNNLLSEIPVTAVVRTSDTVVTITLPALEDYDITESETITATIPGSAQSSGSDVVVEAFTIDPVTSDVVVTGTFQKVTGERFVNRGEGNLSVAVSMQGEGASWQSVSGKGALSVAVAVAGAGVVEAASVAPVEDVANLNQAASIVKDSAEVLLRPPVTAAIEALTEALENAPTGFKQAPVVAVVPESPAEAILEPAISIIESVTGQGALSLSLGMAGEMDSTEPVSWKPEPWTPEDDDDDALIAGLYALLN